MDRQTPEAITQRTPISEVGALLRGTDPVTVRPDDSLHRLAELAIDNTRCRVLSVVDARSVLIGLVPVRLLVNDIFLKIVPEEFLGVIGDVEDVLEYAGHVGARSARDIMLAPVSVKGTDTVRIAFERMHKARLNGLPIVDEAGRVSGYLDQLELLLVWVRASGSHRLLEPHDHERGRAEEGSS
jgi:CBS domain-containing protein